MQTAQTDFKFDDSDPLWELSHEAHLVSFDVFDTLLARRAMRPTDVFIWMERHFSVPEFAKLRVEAERVARIKYKTRGQEVSLSEIYEHFPREFPITPKQELDAEKRFLFAVPKAKRLVERLKGSGVRVVAVSDMYLTSGQVESLLQSCGIFVDKVYTSADLRSLNIGKYNGRMFEYVCQAEGLDPSEVVHFGDNFVSDVSRAVEFGQRAALTDQPHYMTAQVSRLQGVIASISNSLSHSIIAGITSERIMGMSTNYRNLEEIAFSVGGPLVAGIIADLNSKACDGLFDRLVLLERDGLIIKKALDVLVDFGVQINFSYVSAPCSRRLSIFPLYAIHGYERISVLFSAFDGEATMGQILDLLGLEGPADCDRSFRAPVAEVIDRNSDYFLSVAHSELGAIRDYYRKEVFSGPGRIHAWFDVGWALSSITALNEILGIDQHCYCLGSNGRADLRTGHTGYLFTRESPKLLSKAVAQKVELVELLFSSEIQQAMYIEYTDGVASVARRGEDTFNNFRREFVQRASKQIIDFIRILSSFFPEIDPREISATNAAVLLVLLTKLDEIGAGSLRGVVHDLGAGNSGWKPMGSYW